MPSKRELFWLWCAAHRRYFGWGIGLLALYFRFTLSFEGHTEYADHLKDLALIILAGGAYTAGAGSHHGDSYWKDRKDQATMPPQMRPMLRRKIDG